MEKRMILLAIISCENNAYLGYPQAQRDTWLKDVEKHPELEYRFFYGDGKPTGEDENKSSSTYAGVEAAYSNHRHIRPPVAFKPRLDEVVLSNTPDDYGHHAYKTRNKLRWAVENGYEYVLTCNDDLYLDIDRFMNSDFREHDFTGRRSSDTFIHGGPGICLSKKSVEILATSPINTYGGDGFMAQSLVGKVRLHFDDRYTEWPDVPRHDNDKFASHLIVAGSRMHEVYRGLR
jgi:hypothetical protein